MQKTFLSIACVSGALAVVLGAFGAHALKAKISPADLQVFETGIKYQMYHTFALIAIGILMDKFPLHPYLNGAGYFFIAGMIFFSGSLYLLATRHLLGIENWRWMGPVTPLGGLSFIIGWVLLLLTVSACSPKSKPNSTLPETFRLIVTFASQGEGTDAQGYTLFQEYLKKHPLEKTEGQSVSWGKEGETDYCFHLKTLNPAAQQDFIEGLKTLLKEHPLVQFKENTVEHRITRKF
jgi:uncharacterized membrane protein YgdD (TMEM256/DUF423 family)